jgi:hypothetical protein
MTIEEIQARLDALAAAMSGKGLIQPEARVHIEAGGRLLVAPAWRKTAKSCYTDSVKVFTRNSIPDALDAADAWCAALPAPETLTMRTYLGKLADAVDYGHANGIPAEYVDPVRITQKAMSDNLLAPMAAE